MVKAGLRMARDHPLAGIVWEVMPPLFLLQSDDMLHSLYAHSFPIQLLSETGLLERKQHSDGNRVRTVIATAKRKSAEYTAIARLSFPYFVLASRQFIWNTLSANLCFHGYGVEPKHRRTKTLYALEADAELGRACVFGTGPCMVFAISSQPISRPGLSYAARVKGRKQKPPFKREYV